jgi:hypothetical protein
MSLLTEPTSVQCRWASVQRVQKCQRQSFQRKGLISNLLLPTLPHLPYYCYCLP